MKENKIALWILVSLILGAIAGVLLNDPSWNAGTDPVSSHSHSTILQFARFFGVSIFLALLKVLIVPLVASTVFVAVGRIGTSQLGRLGAGAIFYYFCTMLIAVVIGIVLVTVFSPGVGLGDLGLESAKITPPDSVGKGVFGLLENLTSLILPTNILASMAQGQTLSVICFFIFFGIVVALLGENASLLLQIGEQISNVLLKMVFIILHLAPFGVFCLILDSIAQHGLSLFTKAIGMYVFCVSLGLAIHAFVVLPFLLRCLGKRSVVKFFLSVRNPLLMAFGTASSSATLPVSLNAADEAGVDKKVSGVVLPLGSTINMDGTALYEAVAVIFLAQLSGADLGLTQILVVAFTATLAAVGAAGIPSAGLVTLFIVVDAVNGSLTALSPDATLISLSAVGLILGVDRILDMMRTTVNVWGDLVGAAILDRTIEK